MYLKIKTFTILPKKATAAGKRVIKNETDLFNGQVRNAYDLNSVINRTT